MPPGEPVASNSDQDNEKNECSVKSPKYQPAFKNSDWFVAPLINFDADSSSMEDVYNAARYWRDIALELKANNYPIAEGIDNWKQFDAGTRQKARMLDDFLNMFITNRLFTHDDAYSVLRVLIAQGAPYLEFKEKMARVNFSLKCNTIWENDAVAYRCNTCALTPCMSLCEACFDANGHEGHDYTRFFSREGGACDCGNQDVIMEKGNCPEHGDESKRPKYDMNDVCLAEYIVTKLLVRMFLDYRGWASRYKRAEQDYLTEANAEGLRRPIFDLGTFTERDAARCNKIIEFLQECSNYGGPMRMIVSEVLLNTQLYKSLVEKTGEHYDESGRVELSLDWRTSHLFMDDRESLLLPESITLSFPLVDALPGTECVSLLDELIFWIDRQLFPQNLINFGLSMLSEPGYRDAFASRFFAWYPICGKVIGDLCISQVDHARGDDKVSPACSRVVHVTVQMLSSATLCKKLNKEVELMRTVLDVTRFLICKRLTFSEISLRPPNIFAESTNEMNTSAEFLIAWDVMTMRRNAAISQHGYWFVMGDIQNVLTHTELAVDAVLDDSCFGGSYMRMMCQMQGMNPIWRIISGNAQELDAGDEVQKAYTLEFETLAVTLFNIVAAIQQEKSVHGAFRFFDHVHEKLEQWFQHLSPVKPEQRNDVWSKIQRAQAYAVTFHIPLHRHISTALTHFSELEGFYDYVHSKLLRDEILVRLLLIHPLRIQVARSEINCGMWVRNSAQARMSSLIYSQWNVSSAFQTPDIDLIRFCAAHIDKEVFVSLLSLAFNVSEKIRFRMRKQTRRIPAARQLFDGSGDNLEEEQEDVPEDQRKKFEEFRKLIRENPKLIEDIMQNASGKISEGSTFDDAKREEVIELLCSSRNATQVIIEFTPPVFAIAFAPREPDRLQQERDRLRRQRQRAPSGNQNLVRRLIEHESEDEDNADDPPTIEAPRRPPALVPRLFENENEPRLPVIRDHSWIDPMFWGMFKLVAELIVVRVNSGATSEEHYRSEMVNCMAMGNVPYSKLRGSISEKGSRGSEMVDKHFERILTEIGDFIEPNESPSFLQQGSYQLKTSIWDSELCPVFFMMRSSSMKQAREVFARMEDRERKNAIDRGGNSGDVKMETAFWVPFRLIDFDEKRRHRGIANIYTALLTERFMLHCVAVLATGQDSVAKFHEATIQMAVYMLTLAVKYALEYQGSDDVKQHLRDIFHTPFRLKKEYDVDSYHTICSFMIKLLEEDARKKDSLIPIYRNILEGIYDKQKVTGGRMIYLARFVTILSKLSPTCRKVIQEKLTEEELQLSRLAIKEESAKNTMDPAKAAAKEAARRRMAAIMRNSAQKNVETMQKLMAKEGMTADEVETVDPSQQNRQVYECPICGEQEAPNTVEHPFGMLAKLSTNFLCEEQIDQSCKTIRGLMEYDRTDDSEGTSAQMETRHGYADKRRMASVENPQPEIAKVKAPLVGTDLKTCGHTAHIECFNAYRASLYDGRQRPVDRREVGCPLCRFTVNTIVPMSFDKPYSPVNIPASPLTNHDVWKVMKLMLKKAREPVFEEDEKNVRYATLYSTREGGGLFEVWVGRQNSADWTERQSSFEKCTVSTVMISLAVAMVERSSLLRTMQVPERRKNARNSLTEHVMTASVATSKDVDFDVTMSAMSSLFLKVADPAPQIDRAHVPGDPNLRPEHCIPQTSSAETEAIPPKSSRKRSIHADSQSTMKVAVLALEPNAQLVRMIAILIDNQSITKEMKQEIARGIIGAVAGWVSVHTILCLVLRLGEQKIRELGKEKLRVDGFSDDMHDIAVNISKALTFNTMFFDYMSTKLASPENELTASAACSTYQAAMSDFFRFASELLYHCSLGCLDDVEFMHNSEVGLMEQMQFLGIDTKCLNPEGKSNYWTLLYRNNLGRMSNLSKYFQPCITEPLTWKPRRLLRPPRSFEELFTRYFHRECLNCTTSPTNPIVCLLCGQLLCLDDCCRVTHQEAGSDRVLSMSEVEAHAERCSSSSGLFISITSSMVLVVRGKQAAIWGTVYLDSHKEEDRNLKRGKPLYLCESRFKWLEYDWAEQEWQRVYQWINLSNSHAFINGIRECHLSPHH